MGEWRCGTCHKLIMNQGDANWHTQNLGHEPPYDNEPGEDKMTCKHDMRHYIYDCDGFICGGCGKTIYWVDFQG